TGLITYGAIGWVVDQQHLHDALACFQHLRRGTVLHFHAVHHRSAARGYQLRHGAWVLLRPFAHFDQTGTALPAATFQLGIVAHRRRDDVATDRAGRIQYGGPRCNFHRNTVNAYLEFNVFSHSFSAIRCQPSAASPVNFVLNYFSDHRLQGVGIVRQPVVAGLRLLAVGHMPFKFVPEMPDRATHGPCSRIAKRTYRVTLDVLGDIHQQIDIAGCAVAVFDFMQYFFHPPRTLTAR